MKVVRSGLYYIILVSFYISCSSPRILEKATGAGLEISDDSLLNLIQYQTFQYFWKGAEPNSGMAPERIHMDNIYPQNDKNVVTLGGGGFGVMAILAGIERGFISRKEGVQRLIQIVDFLEKADRFHGVWPHWLNGQTGKVKPFSKKDDGGDIVETAFMVQGLLCLRQYFKDGNKAEKELANKADQLWKDVNWDYYRNGTNSIFWHWSPQYSWEMNFPIHGYNECLLVYVLAASSPTFGISKEVYDEGWADSGRIKSTSVHYGETLQLYHQGTNSGGPLFWAHYSFLGLDPRGLKDEYADYWKENTSQALINYEWCVDNPLGYEGYGPHSWGLSSSYSVKGYAGHAPQKDRDLGVIAPTAAVSSIVYTPEKSMAAIKYWYTKMKDELWGPYGFYDAFSVTDTWYPQKYLAIDQGPQVVMIENYRSGLLWNLFMSSPEIKQGLRKLRFESPHLSGASTKTDLKKRKRER